MSKVYWIDLSFEEELEKTPLSSIAQRFVLQMEVLPLFFAKPEDYVVITAPIKESYVKKIRSDFSFLPKIISTLKKAPKNSELIVWGGTDRAKQFAEEYDLQYSYPSTEITQKVHSKIFSYTNAPKLPNSKLCHTKDSLQKAIQARTEDFVVKKAFGCASRGMEINPKQIQPWMIQELEKRPLIIEPWVNRMIDFSTQWYIDSDQLIHLLGICRMINTYKGQYVGTIIGEERLLFQNDMPFIKKHIYSAKQFLKKVAQEGYFGYIGVDGLVYEKDQQKKLLPILELNCRMTMSLVALKIQKKYFPKQIIYLHLTNEKGLLPNSIFDKPCKKNIRIDCISPDLYPNFLRDHASKKPRKILD